MNEKGSAPPSYTSQPGGGYVGQQGYPQGSQPPPGQYPQGPGQYPQAQPGQYPQASYPAPGQPGVQYPGNNTVVVTTTTTAPQPQTPLPCSYIVGLVFAILSFFLGCWLLAIPAIVFAALSLGSHATDPNGAKTQCLTGMGFTIASFVCSAIIIIVLVVSLSSASVSYGYYG